MTWRLQVSPHVTGYPANVYVGVLSLLVVNYLSLVVTTYLCFIGNHQAIYRFNGSLEPLYTIKEPISDSQSPMAACQSIVYKENIVVILTMVAATKSSGHVK